MMRGSSLSCLVRFAISSYRNHCLVSFAWNAAWLIVPLVALQVAHSSCRLSRWPVPPMDGGTRWSGLATGHRRRKPARSRPSELGGCTVFR